MADWNLTPTQEAKGIIAAQARAYLDAGQPEDDCGCDDRSPCRRCRAVRAAINRIADRLDRDAGKL